MVHVISGETCPNVWLQACQFLLTAKAKEKYCAYNVVLQVTSPLGNFTTQDQAIYNAVSDFLIGHGSRNLDTIANTIFPSAFYYPKLEKKGVLEDYPNKMEKIITGWGSYALRMVKRKSENGEWYNPLERLIDKINAQPSRGKCLELGMLPFDADIQLYDPRTDRKIYMGGPCLSHISVKVINSETINLTALYRNHFYIERLLGNLVGLSQLLGFIAKETNLKAGELIIHSTSAEIDTGKNWKVTDVKNLIDGLAVSQKAA